MYQLNKTQKKNEYPFRVHKYDIRLSEWNKTIWLQLGQLQMAILGKNEGLFSSKPTNTSIHFKSTFLCDFVPLYCERFLLY